MSTRDALRQLLASLGAALGPDAAGLADTFGRFDGEPADAIDEHVADLSVPGGASVLVGFLSDDVTETDEEGDALSAALRPSVVVVRRRGHRGDGAGVPGATADAEAVDDLYDAAAIAAQGAGWRILRGRALAGDTRDWFGRALVVERGRPFPPEAS